MNYAYILAEMIAARDGVKDIFILSKERYYAAFNRTLT